MAPPLKEAPRESPARRAESGLPLRAPRRGEQRQAWHRLCFPLISRTKPDELLGAVGLSQLGKGASLLSPLAAKAREARRSTLTRPESSGIPTRQPPGKSASREPAVQIRGQLVPRLPSKQTAPPTQASLLALSRIALRAAPKSRNSTAKGSCLF